MNRWTSIATDHPFLRTFWSFDITAWFSGQNRFQNSATASMSPGLSRISKIRFCRFHRVFRVANIKTMFEGFRQLEWIFGSLL